MPTVFSILNHGTKSHRSRTDGEIIADLGRDLLGAEYTDFLITDGPGSDGADKNARKLHPTPGTFDPFTKEKLGKKASIKEIKKSSLASRSQRRKIKASKKKGGAGFQDPVWAEVQGKALNPKYSNTPMGTLLDITKKESKEVSKPEFFEPEGHGTVKFFAGAKVTMAITGHGWDDNIRHAVASIGEAFAPPAGADADVQVPYGGRINMIGWSRGAVTCLRMANWIKEFYGSGFEVNIFAIDPVAGLDAGTKLRDTFTIPDIVKDYVAVLALDEKRNDFKPQDLTRIVIQDKAKSNVVFLPFPGVHNTPVLKKAHDLTEVTDVVRALAYSFLRQHGTQFKVGAGAAHTGWDAAKYCQLYDEMLKKRTRYAALMKATFMAKKAGGLGDRLVKTGKDTYTPPAYVNQHHQYCAEKTTTPSTVQPVPQIIKNLGPA